MARCDQGYRCDVCGRDVESLAESALYLRYLLGETPVERLHLESERHLSCEPERAQYIVDPRFEPVAIDGPFAKAALDPDYVHAEEERVSAAWRRLRDLPDLGLSILDYPLS
jgi:hypothetical protein